MAPKFKTKPFNQKLSGRSLEPTINIGGGLSLLTGSAQLGTHGELLVDGGLSRTASVCGLPNHFKTSLMISMVVNAMGRFKHANLLFYECEGTGTTKRVSMVSTNNPEDPADYIANGRAVFTTLAEQTGTQFFEYYRAYCKEKEKEKKDYLVETPFYDVIGEKPIEIIYPSFCVIDSFSKFTTDAIDEMQKVAVGDSKGISIDQIDGREKKRIWALVPRLSLSSNTFFLTTAHVKNKNGREDPNDKYKEWGLKALPKHLQVVNVSTAWEFNTQDAFFCSRVKNLITDKKECEYPSDSDDKERVNNTELVAVTIVDLRNKNGKDGFPYEVVFNKSSGVDFSLTEYHNLRSNGYFGIGGTPQSQFNILYPDVKFARTTISGKLKKDRKLRRAMTIINDLWIIKNYWYNFDKDLLCTPEELYARIKDQGYNWDFILESTVDWWFPDGAYDDIYTLSTPELLKVAHGLTKPWWLKNKNIAEKAMVKL